ncbi:MAG TPA: uroporphyrinogen decarboxylase family protein [Candidatus Brocadiia bacterium]|nr:uroporphyrinogen decarboxylase family protein [Candidatus Brocadiia bacterium]
MEQEKNKLSLRERFVRAIEFKTVDVPFVRAVGGWAETGERWRKEGWDGRSLTDIFHTDWVAGTGVYYGPVPRFEYRLVEEDETHRIYINHEGILMKEFKQFHGNSSMPQFLKFPVETEAEFDAFSAERLAANFEKRRPENWSELVKGWKTRDYPLMCFADRWGGFFGPLRNLMGLQNLCMAFYDQPSLVEKMMEQRADVMIEITNRMLDEVELDVFAFWEDMAYNTGPLIGPDLFRKFALKHYKRVCEAVRKRGVKHIGLDSDGDITLLIPIWLEAGIDVLWPFEAAAGMDVAEVRKQYGKDLAMIGGIDKRAVATGGKAMRAEVDRITPVVESGGYIPELDHAAPPDISWGNMREFMEYLLARLGRG